MKKQLTFTLPLPPALNATYKIGNRRMYKSQEATDWEHDAYFIIQKEKRHQKAYTGSVEFSMEMFLKRDRDCDSSLKLILDTLQKTQVLENDNQVTALHVFKNKDKENPRIEVIVTEID